MYKGCGKSSQQLNSIVLRVEKINDKHHGFRQMRSIADLFVTHLCHKPFQLHENPRSLQLTFLVNFRQVNKFQVFGKV